MNLGRTFRTVRHLSAEQWFFRFVCRGRFEVARRLPGPCRRYVARTARALPAPDTKSESLLAAARHVLMLQQSVHGRYLDGILHGRFHFLARSVEFSGFDAIEWRRDLGEKNNPLWRMNLSYLGWLVCLLAQGRNADIECAETVVRSLEAQNGWSEAGVFRDVWHPYSASHRLINLLCGLALYRAAGGAPAPRAEAVILDHARFCAAFLLHNLERDLQYNHLFKNYVALAVYCAASQAHCVRLGFLKRGIASSLRQQLLADGGQAERAPMYHALFLLDLFVLQACGIPVDDALETARAALGVMSHPDGDVALFNDSWIGEAPAAAALGAKAPAGLSLLPQTGYARLGVDDDAVIFDCGPCGPDSNPGHAHADFLSVEASVGGRRFLVDPGVPTYSQGELRDLCRASASHNGPHLAGAEPIEFWASFRVGRRGRAYPTTDPALEGFAPLWCAGWQDGLRPEGVIVGRWVGLWPGEALLLIDVWHGESAGRAGLNFLVPAAWRQIPGPRFLYGQKQVALSLPIGQKMTIVPAQCWPGFGEAKSAHAIQVKPETDAGGACAATLWHWGKSEPQAVDVARRVAGRLRAYCAGMV